MQTILPGGVRYRRHHAAAQELARRRADAKELPGQVDADHRIPLRQRHGGKGRVALQAGVGDQDIDCSELADHARGHRIDLVLLQDVGLVRVGAAAAGADRVDDRLAASASPATWFTTTSAPAWPSARVMARPMPELAPVTRAFWPARTFATGRAVGADGLPARSVIVGSRSGAAGDGRRESNGPDADLIPDAAAPRVAQRRATIATRPPGARSGVP